MNKGEKLTRTEADPAEFDVAAFGQAFGKSGHSQWLGIRIHRITHDWLELAMDWREDLVMDRDTGVIASGPIVALMDSCAGATVWARSQGPNVTIDLRVDYMRPARPGSTIIARCECYRMARQIGFVRGIGYEADPDDPLCHVAGSFMLIASQATGTPEA